MAISANQINPFLKAAETVINQTTGYTLIPGAASKKNLHLSSNEISIMLGVTGEITGQVIIVIEAEQGKDIASKMMMGLPVPEIDDMAKSALSELGNMIMGTAATILSNEGTIIDITPPTLIIGESEIQNMNTMSVEIPLLNGSNNMLRLYFILKMV